MTDSSFSSTSDNEDLSDIDLLLKVVEYDQSGEAENLRNRNWINCERDIAEKHSRAGYFGANGDPTEYLDLYLRRRYRMSRKLFLEIVEEVHQAAETVTTSNELDLLFGPLFDEYFNGENQVVLKSSAVTTTDASNKRQQQPDSTSSTSTLATTVTANGNFDL
ncbi:hypothetical protein Tco_0662879 [Tanacetum coccineum]